MARVQLKERLAALRSGTRWWPAEIMLRGLGLLLLACCWRVALVAHRMATTPALHEASIGELAVSAVVILLLCSGLTLALVGQGLFRDVPLPPHFTRLPDSKP